MREENTEHNNRRLKLNLSDRQVIKVLALAGEMCLTNYFRVHNTDEADLVLDRALRNMSRDVRTGRRVGDANIEPILRAAEGMHAQGVNIHIAEHMLDAIGGIELADKSTRRFWSVPNVYAMAVEDTRHWNVPDWIKDLGPFWTFTFYLVDDNRVDHCGSWDGSQYMWCTDMDVIFWTDLDPNRAQGLDDDALRERQNKARDWFEEHRCRSDEDDHYEGDGVVDSTKSRLLHHVGSPKTAWSNLDGDSDEEKYSKWTEELSRYQWSGDFQVGAHILDCILMECQELPGGSGMLRRDPEIDHLTHLN